MTTRCRLIGSVLVIAILTGTGVTTAVTIEEARASAELDKAVMQVVHAIRREWRQEQADWINHMLMWEGLPVQDLSAWVATDDSLDLPKVATHE